MSTGAVGIDLGTTFSAIAHVNQHGVPEILPNAEGDRITVRAGIRVTSCSADMVLARATMVPKSSK